jgi:endonuclease-3 related protein
VGATGDQLLEIYERLLHHFGPQGWWPGETSFEIMVGAVLTQNTNWGNVERAIANLKDAGLLSFEKMAELPQALLAEYIRPAGYYNIKAARLGNLFELISSQYKGRVELLLAEPSQTLREQLLTVKGIGPETADSIVLYAAGHPVFVVDAYTHRILTRHNLIADDYGYYEMQDLFMDNLENEKGLFNEYHALLVQVGKEFCKKRNPMCTDCPLGGLLA